MNSPRAFRGAVSILGAAGGIAFLVYVARPHWAGVRDAGRDLDPAWLAAAVVALAAHLAISFAIWRMCLSVTGAVVDSRRAADTWIPSLLARYVPGRVWSHGVRMMLARRAGIALPEVTAAVGWEILLAIMAASLVALVALAGTAIDARVRAAVAALAVGTVVTLVALQVVAARAGGSRMLRRLHLHRSVPFAMLVRLAAAHLAGWAIYGFAHWALARAIAPDATAEFGLVTGGVALAWLGGYIAVFTPAGLGVREGLLALLLAPVLGAGPVVLLAALSRIATIGLEIVLFMGWSLGRRREAEVDPENVPERGQPG